MKSHLFHGELSNVLHLLQDAGLTLEHIGGWRLAGELTGIGQRGGNESTLTASEVFGILMEMLLGNSLGAIDAIAHLDGVEIDLHDALLGPEEFDECSEIDLKTLAHPTAAWPEKDILGGLLVRRWVKTASLQPSISPSSLFWPSFCQ